MSDIGKVRLRIPSSVKPGDVVQVRALVIHPMERIARDAQGKIIQKNYNYINKVVAMYLGRTVATFDTTQNVAENPFFTFTFKATGSGATYVYVEAHKSGEKLQSGVSTANLFKVRVR